MLIRQVTCIARYLPRSCPLLPPRIPTLRRAIFHSALVMTAQSPSESKMESPASEPILTMEDDPFEEEPLSLDVHSGFGFARMELGEKVGPEGQFEVVRKLGWGYYGSVWMVKDLKQNVYQAMKVLTTYGTHLVRGEVKTPGHPRLDEVNIMRHISRKTSSAGARHCLQLIDDFYIVRETGRHLCILTEVTGLPMEHLQGLITSGHGLPSGFAKLFIKHLCLALDYLHSECRIVHTDVKATNILLTFDKKITDELISICFEQRPGTTYPARRIGDVDISCVPTQPLPVPGPEDVHPLQYCMKLADFGSAQWLDRHNTDRIQPIQLRAPEVVLGLEWNEKVDVWSVGCVLFQVLTGSSLFRSNSTRLWEEEDDLLAGHLGMNNTISFPPNFFSEGKHGSHYLKENGMLIRIPPDMVYPKTMHTVFQNYKKSPIMLDDSKEQLDLAVSFIERCIDLDMNRRASAAELLQHPWLDEIVIE